MEPGGSPTTARDQSSESSRKTSFQNGLTSAVKKKKKKKHKKKKTTITFFTKGKSWLVEGKAKLENSDCQRSGEGMKN